MCWSQSGGSKSERMSQKVFKSLLALLKITVNDVPIAGRILIHQIDNIEMEVFK